MRQPHGVAVLCNQLADGRRHVHRGFTQRCGLLLNYSTQRAHAKAIDKQVVTTDIAHSVLINKSNVSNRVFKLQASLASWVALGAAVNKY